MRRALELAQNGVGLTSPNPSVGCVVLDSRGELAGEGWHEYDLRDHAEVVALRNAGERARGGTAFVTLEPCNHMGRTGPCSEALIRAGVARVVAATVDPNPLVAGEGLEKLKLAGIEVEVGVLEAEAQRLNEGFARWIVSKHPFIEMKVAMSLDGRIAPAPGVHVAREPYWVTGPESRTKVQQMRHVADAVLTGVNTVIADDPLLTDRTGNRRRRPLLRVVLDSSLRIPLGSKLVATANGDLVVFTVCQDLERVDALRGRGVRVEILPADSGRVPLDAVLERLGTEEILTLLTETGGRLNTALLAAGLVDRLTVFSSPQIMGSDAVPAFGKIQPSLLLHGAETSRFGRDFCISGLLRDPWREAKAPMRGSRAELLERSDSVEESSSDERESVTADPSATN